MQVLSPYVANCMYLSSTLTAAIVLQKRGEEVAYQGRKKAKTSNILPVTDGNGYIIATTGVIAGNHNDSYMLEQKLKQVFADMQCWGLDYKEIV